MSRVPEDELTAKDDRDRCLARWQRMKARTTKPDDRTGLTRDDMERIGA